MRFQTCFYCSLNIDSHMSGFESAFGHLRYVPCFKDLILYRCRGSGPVVCENRLQQMVRAEIGLASLCESIRSRRAYRHRPDLPRWRSQRLSLKLSHPDPAQPTPPVRSRSNYDHKHTDCMADKLNVSLEPHLREALAALLLILPAETSQQLASRLSSETKATVLGPLIPYELILSISRWCQTTDGKAALQACSPPLDSQSYTMVSLLAGTRTSPEKHFPPYTAKDPEEDQRLQTRDRKATATLVNAVLSVVGTGVATWWASEYTRMQLEWVCELSIPLGLSS